MRHAELALAIDGLGSIEFAGRAYRHTSPGTDPLSITGSRIHGGRWNPPGLAALYFAPDPATVADEWYRAAARQGLDPEGFLPRRLHLLELVLDRVLDLRASEARAALGLGEAQLRGRDLGACRAVGEVAHALDLESIIAPSAAGPGTAIAVFADALAPNSGLRPIGSEVWDRPPPRRT